jgi:hypothetical protein
MGAMERVSYRSAFVGLTLLMARVAGGQTITGKVAAKTDGAPVPGAIVVLLDSTGRALATRLAEDGGSFSFIAPTSGHFVVRVERIGFRSTTSAPFVVRQGDTVDVPVALAGEGVSLRAVVVNADRRCVVRPQEGVAMAQLWNEARKALKTTQLTQLAQATAKARRDPHRFHVRWRKFRHDLAPQTLDVMHSEQVELEGETVTPFVSEDPVLLARDGYVTGGYMTGAVESGSVFYAPDADVLLSDLFLDTHCFRLQAPDHDRRDDLIGLAFEPVGQANDRRIGHVDVRGVLWLDRASAELRYMEYSYTNLPFDVSTRHAGGQLEFRPLPDGRWIVWRWYIRMPTLERKRLMLSSQLSDWRTEVVQVREDGAEVLEVRPAGTLRNGRATLRGTVFDSLSGSTMPGVRVFISGTSLATTTLADGSYRIDSVPPGWYTVSIIAPRVDSLLIEPPARELTVNAGDDKRVDLAVPSLHTLSGRLCAAPIGDSSSVIVGVVRDSGLTASEAHVRAEWTEVAKVAADRLRTQPVWSETMSTTGGRYSLCDIPTDKQIMVRASRGRATVAIPQRPVVRGEVRRVDVNLRKP